MKSVHPQSNCRLKPLALCINLLFFSSVFPAALIAHAQSGPTPQQQQLRDSLEFQIPAGPLAAALNEFAAQSGLFISAPSQLTSGKESAGLQGSYTRDEGLQHLLQMHNLGYRYDDQNSKVITLFPIGKLNTVVVHANLQGDPLSERMSLSAGKIIVGREELEAFGDTSMGEVIRRMPSVSFGGPPGENNDARIRGLGKEYTQILIDGQPVPGREFAIDQIPTQLVERIEIIRTTTTNIDNQGIAGTVNIIMRKPSEKRTGSWSVGAGVVPDIGDNNTTGEAAFSHSDKLGNFRYQFNAVAHNRLGLRTKDRKDYNNGLDILTNREQDHEVREHDEAAFSSRLIWKLNDQDELRFDPRYTYSSEDKARNRLKKADLSDAEHMDQIKERQYAGLNSQWQRSIDEDKRYTLGIQWQEARTTTDKHERKGKATDTFTALPTYVSGNDDLIDEDSLNLRANTQQRIGKRHSLDTGVEIFRNDWVMDKLVWKKEDRSDQLASQFTVNEDKWAAYIQDEILMGERHVLTPGLRLEYVDTYTRNHLEAGRNKTHLQPSPSLHWLTNIDEQNNWRASLTRSIRRPKYEDLSALTELKDGTIDDPDKIGNPELEPEDAWALETSFEHYFNDSAGVASVNLFYRDLKDLIEKRIILDEESGRYQQQPINVESARTWGAELDTSYRWKLTNNSKLTLRGNFSLLDSSLTDVATGKKRPINDQPEHIFNTGFDYEYQPWRLKFGAHYNHVGSLQKADLVGDNYRLQEQDPSHYLDLFVALRLSDSLNLRLSGINLLEAEKNRPRTTTRPDGSIALFEQEDEASALAWMLKLEGKF